MNWCQVICDIFINLCSSFLQVIWDIFINLISSILFVGLIWILIIYLYRRELLDAKKFFGFKDQTQIYISTHGDDTINTKEVVTALEYEAAVELKNTLRDLSGSEFIRKISGLIGQDPKLPEPKIEPSRLDIVNAPVQSDSIILIGGPLQNQLAKYYAEQEKPLLKYDIKNKEDHWQKYDTVNGKYQDIDVPNTRAILVKMKLERQTVFFIFGDGEKETKCAVKYLAENWRDLKKRSDGQSFGICFSVINGKAKELKFVLENE